MDCLAQVLTCHCHSCAIHSSTLPIIPTRVCSDASRRSDSAPLCSCQYQRGIRSAIRYGISPGAPSYAKLPPFATVSGQDWDTFKYRVKWWRVGSRSDQGLPAIEKVSEFDTDLLERQLLANPRYRMRLGLRMYRVTSSDTGLLILVTTSSRKPLVWLC